jgi:serine/threonine-protein phosphatase 4 regulatory subunit 1
MKLTLDLAHEENNEKLRETAVKLINEIAPEMGQELCEFFIVREICSLGYDPKPNVRQAVAKNLVSISKCVSTDCFQKTIFPLYKDTLTKDKEEKVRKQCADIVAELTSVSPIDKTATDIQILYHDFLMDPYSKIVRGTAFQNIGPFIACFKDHKKPIDEKIINYFITTTEKTTSKDVMYYASINFPAFIFVTGQSEWTRYRKLYLKLAQSQDTMTKKTIACSVHELAKILGNTIT